MPRAGPGGHPRSCAPQNPLAALLAHQGSAAVTVTGAAAAPPRAHHGRLVDASVFLGARVVVHNWDARLLQLRCQLVGGTGDSSPACGHIGNTYLTSLPLVIVPRHGLDGSRGRGEGFDGCVRTSFRIQYFVRWPLTTNRGDRTAEKRCPRCTVGGGLRNAAQRHTSYPRLGCSCI